MNKMKSDKLLLSIIRKTNKKAVLGKYKTVTRCRACDSSDLHKIFSLGLVPRPNGFLKKYMLSLKEEYFPLSISFCGKCGMVQLDQLVEPETMFGDYVYLTSASKPMVEHLESFADTVYKRFKLTPRSLVVDIGSNDGTFLRHFKKLGTKILGVDPAKNIARVANKNGIPTIADFFSANLSKSIIAKYKKADVITAVNVVAHVPNWNDLFEGVNRLLDDNGVFIAEFPYLLDFVRKAEFDTIYHEHLSYISIRPLEIALNEQGLEIIDAERYPIHGGSLRVYVQKMNGRLKKTVIVKRLLSAEIKFGTNKKKSYIPFSKSIIKIRKDITRFLNKVSKNKENVIGYGASAKGNIFLNYVQITKKKLPLIVDSTEYKHGLFTPGVHIPVIPEEKILDLKPDYVLVLAWNFADAILEKNRELIKSGVKFVVAIPKLRIYK